MVVVGKSATIILLVEIRFRGAGNAFQWTGKNFNQMGKNMSPNEMIKNLDLKSR